MILLTLFRYWEDKCFGDISIESDSVLIYCKDLVFDSKENTASLKNNGYLKRVKKFIH